jgi:hypothetical protein
MNNLSDFERLEDRTLLAISVTLNVKKGILNLAGDLAGDTVTVVGTGVQGSVEVFVNAVSQGTFVGVRTINATLGAGDDTLNVNAVRIADSLLVNAGAGADTVTIHDLGFGLHLAQQVNIGGSVSIGMGGDAGDLVSIHDDTGLGVRVGGALKILTVADVDIDGNGGTFASQASDVSVGGELRIELSGKGDVNADGKEIDIDDLNVTGSTALNGSEQVDRIEISDSTFTGKFTSTLGGGNDLLDLDTGAGDQSRFLSSVAVDFGAGTDTLDNNPLNTFTSPISGRRGPEVIV